MYEAFIVGTQSAYKKQITEDDYSYFMEISIKRGWANNDRIT